MSRKSRVDMLPEALRLALAQRAFDCNFSNYEGLETWLRDQGYKIGKSSLHRYFSVIERRETEKRWAVLATMVEGSRAAVGLDQKLPLIVQIIDPVTRSISIIPSAASRERIEAAVRGLE